MPSKLAKEMRKLRRRAAREAHIVGRRVLAPTAKAFVGAAAGAASTNPLTAVIASEVQKRVDRKIDKVAGRGTYMAGRGSYMAGRGQYSGVSNMVTPKSITNNLVNGDKFGTGVKFHSGGDDTGSVVLSKREFLFPVLSTGSADFSSQSIQVNPGLPVFQFLSQIGANFTEYEMGQLIFEYRPVISKTSVSSVGSLGTIGIAANYNAGSPTFSTFGEFIDYTGAVEGTAADHIVYGLECNPSENSNSSDLYIRTGAVPTNQDIKTFDLAKVQVCLYGVPTAYPSGTTLGLLYVHYTVKLRKPRIYSALGNTIMADAFAGAGGCTDARPLGTSPLLNSMNTLGGSLSKGTDSVYTFPDDFKGDVVVMYYINGVGVSLVGADITQAGEIECTEMFTQGGTDTCYINASVDAAATAATYTKSFRVSQAAAPGGNYITLTATTTSLGSANVVISQSNPLVMNLNQNNASV